MGEFTILEEKIKKTIGLLKEQFISVRAGRVNPALLDKIMVNYYGVATPISQIATVSVSDGRVIVIQPWSAETLKDIEHAIHDSDINISPSNDGRVLRLPFPPLTEERRKELVKQVTVMSEESKIAIRNARRDAIDILEKQKKSGELTEDDLKRAKETVQKITDKYISEIVSILSVKEKEILEV